MDIGRYIKKLLQEHNIVIVPGLGAFVSVYKPAYMDDKTGQLHPPSKVVSFNENIKNNGGLLTGMIAGEEHISHRKAVGKLEKICDEILYNLDKGEKVTIEETGTLYHDDKGILCFEPVPSLNFLTDSFGLEPVTLYSEKETHLQSSESQQNKLKELYNNNKRSGFRRFILRPFIILIPAILIALGIYLFRKKEADGIQSVKIKIDPTPPSYSIQELPASIDTIITDTVKAISADTTQITHTATPDSRITPDTSEYYLIGGSFKEEENAKKYFQQMKEKGYEPFHLKKEGNFYIVGIGKFNTEKEAYIAQIKFLDKYPDSGVWILIPE